MADAVLYFAVKSIGLSKVEGRKPCTLLTAARHNLREIQAELGAVGHIDAKRIVTNVVLAGPATAIDVQANAHALLAGAGIDTAKLRKDHCQAIEALFSLPTDAAVTDPAAYFAQCLEWVAGALGLPVLSAVLHRDESAPHLHVLLLPVKAGAHVGRKPIADRHAIKPLTDSFFAKVAGPAGLKRQNAKMAGKVKEWAVAAVLRRCEDMGTPNVIGSMWAVLEAAIRRDPTTSMLQLGIDVNSIRPCDADTSPNPIAIEPKAIAFEKEVENTERYPCVAFAPPTPSPKPQKAISTISELWAVVGCKARIKRTDKRHKARTAQQAAMSRHKRTAPAAPSAIDSSVTRVERDEHTHDTSVWD
jgi:hypothetical protein